MRNNAFRQKMIIASMTLLAVAGCSSAEQHSSSVVKTPHGVTDSIKTPSVSTLIEWKQELNLSEDQMKELHKLKSKQDLELKPTDAKLASIRNQIERTEMPSELHYDFDRVQKTTNESLKIKMLSNEIINRYSLQGLKLLSLKQQKLASEEYSVDEKKQKRVLSFPLRGAAYKTPAQF